MTTDNSFLKILRQQGFPGALLFSAGVLAACLALLVGLRTAPPKRRPVAIAAIAAFVSFLILGLTAEYIEQPGKVLAWAMLGVAAWAVCGSTREPSP